MIKFRKCLLTTFLLFFIVSNGEASDADSYVLPFDSDLAAHWALDDEKGSGIAADVLGKNNLQLNKMDIKTSWDSGKMGGALSIGGGDDRVINNAITQALKPENLTLSGWFKVTHGNRQWIAAQADNYGLFLNNNHQVVFYIHHEDDWVMVTAESQKFADNQWHHVAGSYDGKSLKVFFDGKEVAQKNETRKIAYTTGNQFTIGSMKGGRVFSGDIDDVRVYHRALATGEMALLAKVAKQEKKQVKSSKGLQGIVSQSSKKAISQKCGPGQEPHYYVSPAGNDKNNGGHSSPWRTLQYAANQLKCGSLHVMKGVYKEHVTFRHSGTADSYIKILGQKGAIIDGRFGYSEASKGLLTIENASYIILDGITVRNALTHGIMYKGKGKYIFIRNCITEHTRGAGIFVYGEWPFTGYHISHVSVEHNQVHWPQEGRFGGKNIWQEDITLLGGIENFDVSYNYVNAYDSVRYSGGPIGIDVKAGVRNGVVHHNTVENIPSNGIYVDAGEAEAINIKVYQNIVRNVTGFGIPIAGENGGKLDNIEVFNNLIDTSGYSGIAFSDFPPGKKKQHDSKYLLKPRTNIKIYNNTVYNGGAKGGWGWGIMTESQFNGQIYNNVISNSKPSAIKLGHSDTSGVSHNCVQRSSKQKAANSGSNAIIGAIRFVNAPKGDFTLQSNSPCIDSGISKGAPVSDLRGKKRPKGKGVDMGAYEF